MCGWPCGMKRKLLVIGIGAGDPDYVTLQAIAAMQRCDLFFLPMKGEEKADLSNLRLDILDRHLSGRTYRLAELDIPTRREAGSDYLGAVNDWHDAIARRYRQLFESQMSAEETAGLLVWGDPSLYDSTLRIVERLAREPDVELDYAVIPGITAIQALAARHRITLNDIGDPFLTTTGRRLVEAGMPEAGNAVVMLDGALAFTGLDPDLWIYWGAYLGTPDELLVAGRLGDVSDEIVRQRSEARQRKGWIMDTYLLKRSG